MWFESYLQGFFLLVINSITSNLCLLPGINVKKGRGRYIDTCMVTFAPRYLLDNKSSYKLAFVQREFARGQVRAFLSFPPGVRHSVLQLQRMQTLYLKEFQSDYEDFLICYSNFEHSPSKIIAVRGFEGCIVFERCMD